MTMRLGRCGAIWFLVGIEIALLAGASAKKKNECVPVSNNIFKPRDEMAVYRINFKGVSKADGIRTKLLENDWFESPVNLFDYWKRRVELFAAAKDEPIGDRFRAKQMLDLNYYNLTSDCTMDKSRMRYENCAKIMSGESSPDDRLVRNLFRYCNALASQVDNCCRSSILKRVMRMPEHIHLIKAYLVYGKIRADALQADEGWLSDDEVLERLSEQEGGEKLIEETRENCRRLLESMEMLLARGASGMPKMGLISQRHICRKLGFKF